jgi:DNA invertase Pin-like site-specific DNA recombinase
MSARARKAPPSDDLALMHGYGRVSSSEQADNGLSLPNQFRRIHEYGQGHDDWIIGDDFQDVESGRKDARIGYQRLLLTVRGQIAAGRRVVIVVLRFDRLGRNMLERVRVYREITALGAEVHSVTNGGQVPQFVYDVLSAAAEEESRLISERVRDVWGALDDNGWHRPGRPAWGYAWRPATAEERGAGAPKSVLVIDESEAPYAREMWRRYAGGESVEGVLKWTAGLSGVARGERVLKGSAVRTLLRSPVYVGRLGGPHDLAACMATGEPCAVLAAPRARWVALVDDATWMAVHEQFRLMQRLPSQASGEYLLTGLVRCHVCGWRMRGNPGNRARARRDGVTEAGRTRRYVCSSRYEGGYAERARPCYASVLARKIEEPVLLTITELLERARDPSLDAQMEVEHERQRREASSADVAGRIAAVEAQRSRAVRALSGASRKFALDEMTRLAYDITAADLQREIEACEATLVELRGTARRPGVLPLAALMAGLVGWADALVVSDDGDTPQRLRARRALLATLLESVRPVRVGTGRYEVGVDLTATGRRLLEYVCAGAPSTNLVSVRQLGTTNCRTGTQSRASKPLVVERRDVEPRNEDATAA